jgi:hypothetical protein
MSESRFNLHFYLDGGTRMFSLMSEYPKAIECFASATRQSKNSSQTTALQVSTLRAACATSETNGYIRVVRRVPGSES